ncbi:MAG: hypothetical protein IPP90_06495 [Gemmatimonadaceae bacterium]|nr:hypothetical protein [Gemmatimonadaceae bacterium]
MTGAGDALRGWRVGHQGRDGMYYEELHDGAWRRIEVQGEMLMGRAHHVIYFASLEEWQRYPEWARHRRAEIIARIVSEFRQPDYEYHGLVAAPVPSPSTDVGQASVHAEGAQAQGASRTRTPPQGMRALVVAIALVFTISGGMAWLVGRGLTTADTFWPARMRSQRRVVSRAAEPVMYWTALAVYSTIGLGTLSLGVWGIREGQRLRQGRR